MTRPAVIRLKLRRPSSTLLLAELLALVKTIRSEQEEIRLSLRALRKPDPPLPPGPKRWAALMASYGTPPDDLACPGCNKGGEGVRASQEVGCDFCRPFKPGWDRMKLGLTRHLYDNARREALGEPLLPTDERSLRSYYQ